MSETQSFRLSGSMGVTFFLKENLLLLSCSVSLAFCGDFFGKRPLEHIFNHLNEPWKGRNLSQVIVYLNVCTQNTENVTIIIDCPTRGAEWTCHKPFCISRECIKRIFSWQRSCTTVLGGSRLAGVKQMPSSAFSLMRQNLRLAGDIGLSNPVEDY